MVAASTAAQATGGTSQRQFAKDHGIPRATLQGWCRAAEVTALDDPQRQFLESPAGLALVHRILLAALVVMVLRGGLGVSQVRLFLTLSGLHTVIACAETTLRRRMDALVRAVVAWGTTQDHELAAAMPPRTISVAVDETNHGGMLLVALEMVSGFLLVEARSALRDGATWAAALKARLTAWPVTVVQLVADEARGLWKLARSWLKVAKVADLFHGQYELTRGVLSAAHHRVGAVAQRVAALQKRVGKRVKARARYDAIAHGPGRPPDWQGRAERVYDALGAAQTEQYAAAEQAAALGRAVRDLRALNDLHVLSDGSSPLRSWLQAARTLAAGLEQRRVFELALRHLLESGVHPTDPLARATDPNLLVSLRDVLVKLYPSLEDGRRVAHDARLDEGRIAFEGAALTRWHAILGEAARTDHLPSVVKIALDEYGQNDDLTRIARRLGLL